MITDEVLGVLEQIYPSQDDMIGLIAEVRRLREWYPIEDAPRDGLLMLGWRNSKGKWRTCKGGWFAKGDLIDWEHDEECPAGWYEVAEMPEEVSAWLLSPQPTHWRPLPDPPREAKP